MYASPSTTDLDTSDEHKSIHYAGMHFLRLGSTGKYTLRFVCVPRGLNSNSAGSAGERPNIGSDNSVGGGDADVFPLDLSATVQVLPEETCRCSPSKLHPHNNTSPPTQNRAGHILNSNTTTGRTVITADQIAEATIAHVHQHRVHPSAIPRFHFTAESAQQHLQHSSGMVHVVQSTWQLKGPLALDGTTAAVTQMPVALGLRALVPKTWSVSFWILLADDPSFGTTGETMFSYSSRAPVYCTLSVGDSHGNGECSSVAHVCSLTNGHRIKPWKAISFNALLILR
jgi:hypothetical protein